MNCLEQCPQPLSDSNPIKMDEFGNIIGYLGFWGDSRDYEFCELSPHMRKVMLKSLHFWLVLISASSFHESDPDICRELIDYAMQHPANQ